MSRHSIVLNKRHLTPDKMAIRAFVQTGSRAPVLISLAECNAGDLFDKMFCAVRSHRDNTGILISVYVRAPAQHDFAIEIVVDQDDAQWGRNAIYYTGQ